jgi:uncharacterized protein YggE
MKKLFFLTIIFICLIIVFSIPCLGADQTSPSRLITVSGDAEINVVPDEVTITLGVETWNKDLATAKQLNDERVKKILALANRFKIDPKYVQTDYITIEPRYSDNYEKREFVGFFVQKHIVFVLKDVSKFEDLLSRSLSAGANYVMGVDFRTTELRKYRDQARKLAINAAKEKAVDLAGELGQKIGDPITITENSNNWYSWYGGWRNPRGNQMTQNVIQNSGDSSGEGSGTIALGQISVKASVTVSFELE